MKYLAILLSLMLAACSRELPPGVTELTYATPYAPTHPFSRADIRWMEFVEKRSGGTLRVRPIWSGALLSSDMSLEELRHNVVDIGLITPIYVRGGTHLVRVQSGFYSGTETVEAQVALYQCIARGNPQIAKELAGLKILAVQGGLLPGIVTRDRQVKTLEDIKGLRLRAPTELLRVLESLGADPVNMPMGEVYSAMAKGVIDGVIAPVDTFKALHFAEVAKYYNMIAVPRGAYPARAIGQRRWDSLSAEHRRVLEEATLVWEAALAEEIRAAGQEGLKAAQQGGIVMSPISPPEQARFDALYLRDAERNAVALRELGIDGMTAFSVARRSIVAPDKISCGGAA